MKRFASVLLIGLVVLMSCSYIDVYAEDTEYKSFLQGDDRWGDYVYGGGATIRRSGCAITSFAVLMAYADPSLRDVKKFNPEVCAKSYLNFAGDCVYWNPKSGPLKLRQDLSFVAKSEQDACKGIKDVLDKGYYVIMWGTPSYDTGYNSSTHYSPVVGWDDSKGKPILWDVAMGNNTWDAFAKGGISSNDIHVYESSKLPSTEALSGTTGGETELTSNQKDAVKRTVSEWELRGMPEKSKIADQSLSLRVYDSSSLSLNERVNLSTIKDDINSRNNSIQQTLGVVFVILGLLLIVYTLLILLGYIFDRVNNFLNFSIIALLSFGKLKVIEYGVELTDELKKEGYITPRSLYIKCSVMFVVGCLFISGLIPMLVMKLIYGIVN